MNRLYGRPEWKKRWRWGLLGILAVFFLIIGGAGGVLLFPYLNLPPVTEEELDRMDLEGFDRIMIVAHPDDELLWGGGQLWLFGQYYRKNKLPYDMKQMDQAVCRQKKQIAELYVSQESTIRKLSHMMPYENWTTEN